MLRPLSQQARQLTPQKRTVAHLGNQGCCVHIHTGNLSRVSSVEFAQAAVHFGSLSPKKSRKVGPYPETWDGMCLRHERLEKRHQYYLTPTVSGFQGRDRPSYQCSSSFAGRSLRKHASSQVPGQGPTFLGVQSDRMKPRNLGIKRDLGLVCSGSRPPRRSLS